MQYNSVIGHTVNINKKTTGQLVALHIPDDDLKQFLNIDNKDQIKHVTLKGNDVSNVVHQYHFNTYSGTKFWGEKKV